MGVPCFFIKTFIKKDGCTNLEIVQGYRNKDGKARHKFIQAIGSLDVLEKEYEDPIAHFKQVAKQMTAEHEEKTHPVTLTISTQDSLPVGTENRKNFGHVAISKLYHELELDYFINNRRHYTKTAYNHFLRLNSPEKPSM